MAKFVFLLLLWLAVLPTVKAEQAFIVLCYHDVREDLYDHLDADQFAVGSDNLIAQFTWLKAHGYQVISVDDLVQAQQGLKPLPEKAVMLSFDDGYASVYSQVFPLLKAFNYPAVVAVVGKWLESDMDARVAYGDHSYRPRSDFLTWAQIKTMNDSGLVEIASHSFDLHRAMQGNPQGNQQPSAVTRRYHSDSLAYSGDEQYRQRITADLRQSVAEITRNIGKQPRVIVWPYGKYSYEIADIAAHFGMPMTMTLRDGINTLADSREIRRVLIEGNPNLEDFVYALEQIKEQDPIRAVRISMDDLYDSDIEKARIKLDQLLDSIRNLKINTVYLSAVTDVDGDGLADAAYFPNRHLPMLSDWFNRVSWQLFTRADVDVYATLPWQSFEFAKPSDTNKKIEELYGDLAKFSFFKGVLFQDSIPDYKLSQNHSALLKSLSRRVQYFHPETKTALALPAVTVAESMPTLSILAELGHCCDFLLVGLTTTPNTSIQQQWLSVLSTQNTIAKQLVFEVQVNSQLDSQSAQWQQLRETYDNLLQAGAIQLSYYPFNVNAEHPSQKILASTLSLRRDPFGP